jgi:hypothetical protein
MQLDKVKGWWAEVERPRRILLCAVALCFVSQFLNYGETQSFFLTNATNTDYYTGMGSVESAASGWRLHPLAAPILLLLATVFASPLARRPEVRRWGYWAALALLFVAIVPLAPVRHFGAMLGAVTFGLAVWAALANRKAEAG